MSKPSPDTVKERLLEWALDGNTDSSSLAVARVLLYGANNQEVDEFPREPVNLQRCTLLIEAVPEARETFPILATSSVFWAALIADWETITQSLLAELNGDLKNIVRDHRSSVPNSGISTPQTQHLMAQTLGRASRQYTRLCSQ